ncbi:MAG TPA: hypothetical protein VGA02_02870 [Gemmatimonadales bacterium]|jgi:hypothetical protein
MFVVKTRRNRNDPRAWLWLLGTLVLPVMILVGLGTGVDRAAGRQAATISVVIHSDGIQMPDSLMAGTITFEVTNQDSVSHGLAVRPIGSAEPVARLDAPLRSGATARTQVTLAAGAYRVYCPNAVERGLMRVVTVLPERSGEPRP